MELDKCMDAVVVSRLCGVLHELKVSFVELAIFWFDSRPHDSQSDAVYAYLLEHLHVFFIEMGVIWWHLGHQIEPMKQKLSSLSVHQPPIPDLDDCIDDSQEQQKSDTQAACVHHLQYRIISILSMRAQWLLLLLAVCAVFSSADELYKKIVHRIDSSARCLDGSPAAMYLHEGNPRKILFYMQGGATCGGNSYSQTLQNCLERSKGHLGSSNYWPETMNGEGLLSRDANKNFLADWTKIVMIYCDGAYHQGYAKDPYKFRGSEIYFRGALNTRAHIKYIDQRYNLTNAEKVIWTGSSAGGIAAYLWTDYVASLLGPQTEYFPIPDSSIFLPFPTPHGQADKPKAENQLGLGFTDDPSSFYNICNKDQPLPNSECVKDNPLEPWKCFYIQFALPYIKSESLFIQSSYDSYIIRYQMQLTCLSFGQSGYSLNNCDLAEMAYIESYRNQYLNFIPELLKRGHNIWTISCSWHANAFIDSFYESPLQRVPQGGNSMQHAVEAFVLKREKVVDIDVESWPANTPCSM